MDSQTKALSRPAFEVVSPISARVLTNITMSFKIELDGFPSLCLGILFLFMRLTYSWKQIWIQNPSTVSPEYYWACGSV